MDLLTVMKQIQNKPYSEPITTPEMTFPELFQKAINDEISATILYLRLANEVVGHQYTEFRQQMKEHAEEEYRHFKDLLSIAANRVLPYTVQLTTDATLPITQEDIESLIRHTQILETQAIQDYKQLIQFSKDFKEYDLVETFRRLLSDETEHFDDVATLTGESRPLPQI